MNFLKSNLGSLALFVTMAALSFYFYPSLPESIATKFDFDGNPTQYSSKNFVAFFMPALYLAIILGMKIFVKASPHKFSMPNSENSLYKMNLGIGLLLGSIHLTMVYAPGDKASFIQFFSFGAALFLIVIGNVFGKTERNFFIGYRVPWTIASEANWRATHRFGGKLTVLFGVLLLSVSFLYSQMYVVLGAIIISSLVPVAYSYFYFRKHERV